MRVQIKTAGLLGRHLPPGSARNRAEVDVPEAATPAAVIALLGMPPQDNYLVSVNGELVPAQERSTRVARRI